MFIGHYAVSFALKAVEPKLSLGTLFLAVQVVDIAFFLLTFLGIEHFSLVENYTASTHFKLEYMPYTHSLVAAFLWAGVTYFLFKSILFKEQPFAVKSAVIMAVAVFSHWCLDLIVHTPDLPVFLDNTHFVGFGLWYKAWLTYLLEAVLVLAGLYWYMTSTAKIRRSDKRLARFGMPSFVALLLVVNVVNIFGPLSEKDTQNSVAITALAAYGLLALIALWLDKKRLA
jgi:hypothetical protein